MKIVVANPTDRFYGTDMQAGNQRTMNTHAQALGRIKSARKAAASRKNGKLGGRPTNEARARAVKVAHARWVRVNRKGKE